MDEMVAKHGARRTLTVFLERKLERLEESYQRGVRHMQPGHYTPNDIGDFQTGAVTHAQRVDAVRRRRDPCVQPSRHRVRRRDGGHGQAGREGVEQAAAAVAHGAARIEGPRTDVARAAPDQPRPRARRRETGGSIGIWHFFPSLERYVDGLKEMADVVGADHVSIGTDQQVAAGSLQDYADFAHLVGAMLSGGFTPADTGKVIGGNFLRIFAGSAG
jgi:membrane dipeptidase